MESVLNTMTKHSAYLMRRSIELTMDLVYASQSVDEFTEKFYDKMLDWWSWPKLAWTKDHFSTGISVETISIVVALLYLCQSDANQCMI